MEETGKVLQKWNFGYKIWMPLAKGETRLQNGKVGLQSTFKKFYDYMAEELN